MKTYADGAVELHHADCLDVLRAMPAASVDAVVTDPPYGLADHHPKVIETALRAWLSGDREHVPNGRGFMGREWDKFVPPPAVWDECFRVLKPGGHLLAFAASRTADLMTMSIRLAGFEIRDSIKWIFAQGFPKSLNVSRAVDEHRATGSSEGVGRVRSWLNAQRLAAGLSLTQVNDALGAASNGGGLASSWMTNPTSQSLPSWDQWCALKALIGFGNDMDGEVRRLHLIGSGLDRPVVGVGRDPGNRAVKILQSPASGTYAITGSATVAALQWDGWGTALKPAHEPIVVARKHLAGTVARNVLEHGTGAINVDGCRIPGRDRTDYGLSAATRTQGATFGTPSPSADLDSNKGRWPTNVVMSHSAWCEVCECGARGPHEASDYCYDRALDCVPGCPVAQLDGQSGATVSRAAQPRTGKPGNGWRTTNTGAEYDDAGGASRFLPVFRYEPKAPGLERPRAADGTQHVSVKPLGLIRWLVRLVTPPGGKVVDPFVGSGTTAEACVLEGFDCVVMENHAPYLPLIDARLSKPLQPALDIFGGAA